VPRSGRPTESAMIFRKERLTIIKQMIGFFPGHSKDLGGDSEHYWQTAVSSNFQRYVWVCIRL